MAIRPLSTINSFEGKKFYCRAKTADVWHSRMCIGKDVVNDCQVSELLIKKILCSFTGRTCTTLNYVN